MGGNIYLVEDNENNFEIKYNSLNSNACVSVYDMPEGEWQLMEFCMTEVLVGTFTNEPRNVGGCDDAEDCNCKVKG